MPPIRELFRTPDQIERHYWADWLELLCLTSLDSEFSAADFIDRLQHGTDVGEGNEVSAPVARAADTAAERDDDNDVLAADLFRLLRARRDMFGDAYPFMISDEGPTLIRPDPLSSAHRLYVFLLLCANLRYVPRNVMPVLTAHFERVSAAALSRHLPREAEVHIFGTAGGPGARYTGTLVNKLRKLADDLGEEFLADPETYSGHDVGDQGLDIVAWLPLGDDLAGRVLVFAQAACTPEWVSKQHSATGSSWNRVISLILDPVVMTFIPHCFRSATGGWYDETSIHRSVVIDRARLVRLLLGPPDNPAQPGIDANTDWALPEEFLDEVDQWKEPG